MALSVAARAAADREGGCALSSGGTADPGSRRARGDTAQLRFAFEALLDQSLRLVPDHGSLYLASRYEANGLRGRPCVRVLVRFHGPEPGERGARIEGQSPAENSLDFAVAETIVSVIRRAHVVPVNAPISARVEPASGPFRFGK